MGGAGVEVRRKCEHLVNISLLRDAISLTWEKVYAGWCQFLPKSSRLDHRTGSSPSRIHHNIFFSDLMPDSLMSVHVVNTKTSFIREKNASRYNDGHARR